MDTDYREINGKEMGTTIAAKNRKILRHPLFDVDESALSRIDRLGLAACRLNSWMWDEYVGPKPERFEQLPNYDRYFLERISHPFLMKILSRLFPEKYAKTLTKHDFINPVIRGIESEIGEANISRCYWVYGMKRTEEEWRRWYYTKRFKA